MSNCFTTKEVAELLGTQEWRIRRLFESGDLPEPGRFAGLRVITGTAIPSIVDALRNRGWLPSPGESSSAGPAGQVPHEELVTT